MSARPKLSRVERIVLTFIIRTLAMGHVITGVVFTFRATAGAADVAWWWYVLGVLYLFGFGATLTCIEHYTEKA